MIPVVAGHSVHNRSYIESKMEKIIFLVINKSSLLRVGVIVSLQILDVSDYQSEPIVTFISVYVNTLT